MFYPRGKLTVKTMNDVRMRVYVCKTMDEVFLFFFFSLCMSSYGTMKLIQTLYYIVRAISVRDDMRKREKTKKKKKKGMGENSIRSNV